MTKHWLPLLLIVGSQILLAALVAVWLRMASFGDSQLYLVEITFVTLSIAQSVLSIMLGVVAPTSAPLRIALAVAVPTLWCVVDKSLLQGGMDWLLWVDAGAVAVGWSLRLSGLRLVRGNEAESSNRRQFSIIHLIELTTWCGLLAGAFRLGLKHSLPHSAPVELLFHSGLCCIAVWTALGTMPPSWRAAALTIAWVVFGYGAGVLAPNSSRVVVFWFVTMEVVFVATAAVPLRMFGYRLTRPPRAAE